MPLCVSESLSLCLSLYLCVLLFQNFLPHSWNSFKNRFIWVPNSHRIIFILWILSLFRWAQTKQQQKTWGPPLLHCLTRHSHNSACHQIRYASQSPGSWPHDLALLLAHADLKWQHGKPQTISFHHRNLLPGKTVASPSFSLSYNYTVPIWGLIRAFQLLCKAFAWFSVLGQSPPLWSMER